MSILKLFMSLILSNNAQQPSAAIRNVKSYSIYTEYQENEVKDEKYIKYVIIFCRNRHLTSEGIKN